MNEEKIQEMNTWRENTSEYKLRSMDTAYFDFNTATTNETGFNMYAADVYYPFDNSFGGFKWIAYFWTNSEHTSYPGYSIPICRKYYYDNNSVRTYDYATTGFSVRCIKTKTK